MGKQARNGATEEKRRDALAILTDEDLREALRRRRGNLVRQLADLQAECMAHDFDKWPQEQKDSIERGIALYTEAIEDIDGRIDGASELLRAFSGRQLETSAPGD